MSNTEVEEPCGTTQHDSSAVTTLTISANAMAMTRGIMRPGKLKLSSTEDMAKNWKVWKQMLNNYMIIAKLCFLLCIGSNIFNGFQFDNPEDKNDLCKMIERFDQYTIGEVNETLERYNFNSRNQEENESIDATALRTLRKHAISVIACVILSFVTEKSE